MLTNEIITCAAELRRELHANPECAGQEQKTKAILTDFLRANTTLELRACGGGFYAAHREPDAAKPAIAIRADYDAIPLAEGGAAHRCGHDGHAATLCALAMAIEGETLGRNVFLLFQPAEETGEGAGPCCALFDMEKVDCILGMHNLPGLPFGQIATRPGTFACASRGLIVHMHGKPAHAAYPENGISPAFALGRMLTRLEAFAAPRKNEPLMTCTVIGAKLGEKAFGTAAADAELWLTLRAEQDQDLIALQNRIVSMAMTLCAEDKVAMTWETQDVFPATVNDPALAARILEITGGKQLAAPMRWSEDFGNYLKRCRGAFLGIGAGENCPALHTADYCYPDALLRPSAEALLGLIAAL